MVPPASMVMSPPPSVTASIPYAPPTAPLSWVIEMPPALALFKFSTRTPTEFAPEPVALPVRLLTVISPAPVALSRSQMPWPARPLMSPVAVNEILPVPFWGDGDAVGRANQCTGGRENDVGGRRRCAARCGEVECIAARRG